MTSNIQPALDLLNDKLRELGRESVKSALAKPQMALAVIAATKDGLLQASDAEAVYAEYVAGRSYAIGRNHLAAGMEDNAKSLAANTSKVKRQIAAAQLPNVDFKAVVDDLTELRAEMKQSGLEVKDVYQAITDAAVVQCKQPNDQLDRDALEGIIAKKARGEDSDLDKMINEYKRLYKLANGADDKPGIAECVPVLEAMTLAIEQLGGDLPAMTAEEKKAEKAMAFLKQTGRITIVTPAPEAGEQAAA